jgi:hypothetical protein
MREFLSVLRALRRRHGGLLFTKMRLSKHFLGRPSLRHIVARNFLLVPLPGHIKAAIAASELLHVRNTVDTRTDDVLILGSISGSESTRAAHVAIAVLVPQKACEETVHHLPIFVEIVALRLLDLS